MTAPGHATTDAELIVTGATVIDPRDGSKLVDHDVVVKSGRIVAVRPASPDGAPRGAATVVDATGKFVVPGFNDMHAHPLVMKDPAANLRLMFAFGVTGFRQMSGSSSMLQHRSSLVGEESPRLLGTTGMVLNPLNAGSEDGAVATVREQHELGADFIKAALVSPPVFYAAQAEANRLGIPILGHLPNGVDVLRASGEGMRSIEHLGPGVGLLACCSSAHDELTGLQLQAALQRKLPSTKLPFMETIFEHVLQRLVINPVNMAKQADVDVLERASSTYDQDAALAMAARLATDGTWQVPTLIRSKTNYACDDPSLPRDGELRYMAPAVIKSWAKATKKFSKFPDPSRKTFRETYAVLLELTKLLDSAGVKMLAGSDACGAAWEVPGASLHQEFDELASAGLTPLRVLQLTTSEPAEFLGATAEMGSVTEGKHADLVLLEADPLESVANLHGVAGVVRDGRYYDRARLDSIKSALASSRAVR